MVIDVYTHPLDTNGTKLEISKMGDQQKKDNINHHRSRTILLNAISYIEYKKKKIETRQSPYLTILEWLVKETNK